MTNIVSNLNIPIILAIYDAQRLQDQIDREAIASLSADQNADDEVVQVLSATPRHLAFDNQAALDEFVEWMVGSGWKTGRDTPAAIKTAIDEAFNKAPDSSTEVAKKVEPVMVTEGTCYTCAATWVVADSMPPRCAVCLGVDAAQHTMPTCYQCRAPLYDRHGDPTGNLAGSPPRCYECIGQTKK